MLHINRNKIFNTNTNGNLADKYAENSTSEGLKPGSNPQSPALQSDALPLGHLALADKWQFEPILISVYALGYYNTHS